MTQVGQRFVEGAGAPGLDEIAQQLRVPGRSLAGAAAALEKAGLLVVTGKDTPRYLPARDLAEIRVNEILTALRRNEEDGLYQRLDGLPAVESLVVRLEQSRSEALGSLTLRELLTREDGEGARDAG
jgi:membrane protein